MLTKKTMVGMIVAILVCCMGLAEGIAPGPAPGQPAYKEGELIVMFKKGAADSLETELAAGKAPSQPAYKEGELIVKFKKAAADSLETQLGQGKAMGQMQVSASLDELGRRYKVKKVGPVIKNFKAKRQRIENLKKKDKSKLTNRERHLLRRLKRAPKGAKVPDLGTIYNIQLEPGQSAAAAVAEYSQDPDVEYAQLNYIVSVMVTEPNDPNYDPEQWSLHNDGDEYPILSCNTATGTTDADIDAPEAWDIETGSSTVTIAVIDTGVDYNHLDLAANMWTDANGYHGYDFVNDDNYPMDDHGHGTHCAGTIGAVGDNALDIAGVCWDVNIMAVKCLGLSGGTTEDLVAGIEYAADQGADVLSNSWGPQFRVPSYPAIEDAVDYAYAAGCVIVFAAGNSNDDVAYYSPANYSKTIAVAATDSDDEKASFSNYGDLIDVAAPGVDILSLRAEGTDIYLGKPGYDPCDAFYPCDDVNATMYICSGTSMACPHVAGLAGLCLAVDANLEPQDVRLLINLNADDIGDANVGWGRINAYSTLSAIPPNFPDPNQATNPEPSNETNFVSVNAYLSWDAGYYASSFDVYLGTDYNDVNDANTSSSAYQGNVIITEYDPSLDVNTTHYWRIDTKNYSSTTKGSIWSFLTRNGIILYVDCDATGTEDGLSWSNAFTSLEDALSISNNDEIWVADGTYKPDTNDRSESFAPPENTQLYGGFAGTESSRDVRDPNLAVNETILSGDINVPNDVNDNCYHVILGSDGVTLDRFTITGGKADANYPNNVGAGMRNVDVVSFKVNDCLFTDNQAGGGASALINSLTDVSTVVSGCRFIGNISAFDAGALVTDLGEAVVTNCTFRENDANRAGGAFINWSSTTIMNNCLFFDNTALDGGAIANLSSSTNTSLALNNCTFSDNSASQYGGEIFNWALSTLSATNCIVWNSDANMIYSPNTSPTFSYCDIEGCGGSDSWDPNFGTDGGGNIDTDPCFVDADSNDFHLASDSNCINAGDPNGDYSGQKDIDGQPRVMAGRVDMGADEFSGIFNLNQKEWYSTIQAAVYDANDTDREWIEVGPGTYCEAVDFNGVPCTLTSVDPNDWNLTEATIIDGNGASNGVLFNSYEDVNSALTGLTVTNATSGVSCDAGAYPTITKCIIEDNSSYGVACFNSSEPLITNNIIRGSTSGTGVYLFGSAATVKNSWLYDNAVGISLGWLFSSAATIRNNTIVDNSYGISVNFLFGTSPDISNCIIWDNDDELKDCTADYSCIKDCNDAAGTGNICGDANDPNFVDPDNDDYHLASGSPCIDAGDPNGTYTGEVDIDFEDRVMGDDVDMGGDERDPNS
jgi:parallel beta-helix repeat protein